RLRKFIRKYRRPLILAGAFAGLLVLGIVVSLGLTIRAMVAEDSAKDQAVTARNERDRAVQAEKHAQEDRTLAEAVDDFLQHDLLEPADPHLHAGRGQAPDKDITVRTILDRAAARIPGRFPNQPVVEASVRHTIGKTYQGLGEYDLAKPHLEAAF